MKPFINRSAIHKTKFRSDEVSVLAYTAHLLKEEGAYSGSIFRKGELLKTFEINCTSQTNDQQVNIDLAGLKSDTGSLLSDQKLEVSPNGYVMFYDSVADDAYQVRVEKSLKNQKLKKEFESKQLDNDDLYSVILLRPGEYTGTEMKNKSNLKITVVYPDSSIKRKSRKPGPVTVNVEKKGFSEKTVEVMPGQPLVFHVKDKSLIQIELKKPFDKKAEVKKPKLSKRKDIRRSIRMVRKQK